MSDLILTPQDRKNLALSRLQENYERTRACMEAQEPEMFDHVYIMPIEWYIRPDWSKQYLSDKGWGSGGSSILPPSGGG